MHVKLVFLQLINCGQFLVTFSVKFRLTLLFCFVIKYSLQFNEMYGVLY